MTVELLFGFILTALIIELTPGPNMAYLVILASSKGTRAGLATTAGVALGLLTVGLVAAIGVAEFIARSPQLYAALRWAGITYLLWLAWWTWCMHAPPTKQQHAVRHHDLRYFQRGFLINVLNPKAATFYTTVVPEFIPATDKILTHTLLYTGIYVGIATAIHVLIVLLSGQISPLLAREKQRIFVRRTMALLLVGVALWLARSTLR